MVVDEKERLPKGGKSYFNGKMVAPHGRHLKTSRNVILFKWLTMLSKMEYPIS